MYEDATTSWNRKASKTMFSRETFKYKENAMICIFFTSSYDLEYN